MFVCYLFFCSSLLLGVCCSYCGCFVLLFLYFVVCCFVYFLFIEFIVRLHCWATLITHTHAIKLFYCD